MKIKRATSPRPSPPSNGGEGEHLSILAPIDRKHYRSLKKLCHASLKAEMEFTAALTAIRDQKLYREEYQTFEDFCRGEFERKAFTIRQRLAQNTLFGQLQNGCPGIHSEVAPGVVRPLLALDPEPQRRAFEQALTSTNGKPTRKDMERAAADLKREGSYLERAGKMDSAAKDELVKRAGDLRAGIKEDVELGIKIMLGAIIKAREMGQTLQMISGHEKLDEKSWLKLQGHGQEMGALDEAKRYISMTERLPQAPANFSEAMQCLEPLLIARGVIQQKQRTETQTASEATPDQEFYKKLSLLRPLFKKMHDRKPMRQWELEQVAAFVAEAKWVVEETETAKQILATESAENTER